MIAYKVVENREGGLWSAYVHDPIADRQYPIGVSVTPRSTCGPLSAFKTLEDALHFANAFILAQRKDMLVFKCRVSRSRRKDREGYALWVEYRAEEFGSVELYGVVRQDLPAGTVLCSKITLLEKVA